MTAGMMDMPLLTASILRHAATCHGDAAIVSRTEEGSIHRGSYAEVWRRSQQLANVLESLGLEPGDRVATLAWNGVRHLELYFAVPGAGMVCHPINPRLFPDQIAYILGDAGDAALFVDLSFVGLLEGIAEALAGLKAIVVMTDQAHMPQSSILDLLCYEDLLAAQADRFDWAEMDENAACGLCYTSGTTGRPKGVVYTHRATVLHALAICLPDVFDLSATTVMMPVVPMFHVNAWGLPYAAPLVGAKLVLPGPKLDGESLHDLIAKEGVTFTAGVPTVWMGLLDWVDARGERLKPLRRVIVGGAACTPSIIERFAALGVAVRHAWGMTEISPVGLANAPKPKCADLPAAERAALALKQGRPMFGIEMSVVDADGREVPRDGKSFGNLLVRGPWVCSGYLNLDESPAHSRQGWFETGDVVTMDPEGYVQIVDRTKDVIKSGGEWISSIQLESIASSHRAVREAAVVARPDRRWGERPLLIVALRHGARVSHADLLAHYAGKVPKWWIPDDVVLVEELPHTATGKVLKSKLRETHGSGARGNQAAG